MLNWLKRGFIKRVCNKRGAWFSIAGWAIAAAVTWVSTSNYSAGQEAKHQKGLQEDKDAANKRMMEKLTAGPAAPTPDDSKEKARLEIERQKRIKALAGGKTILSSEGPTLSPNTGAKTLLGA